MAMITEDTNPPPPLAPYPTSQLQMLVTVTTR